MKKVNGLIVLGIIHKALLAGQVMFAAIAFFLIYTDKMVPSMAELDKTFQLIAVAISVTAVFAGATLFKRKIQNIRSADGTVTEKFNIYRSAYITQWALLEGACIFSLVSFFLIGNYAFLALAAFLIIYFALLAPTKNKTVIHLGISGDEIDAL